MIGLLITGGVAGYVTGRGLFNLFQSADEGLDADEVNWCSVVTAVGIFFAVMEVLL